MSIAPSFCVLSITDPYKTRHGGTLRTRGIIDALRAHDVRVEVLYPVIDERTGRRDVLRHLLKTKLGPMKRKYFPMAFSVGARNLILEKAVVDSTSEGIIVSSLSQFPYVGLREQFVWLDFMDVWSDVARRESTCRRNVARVTTLAQARSLERSESRALASANLITAAGWSDVERLERWGHTVHWLPTSLPDSEFGVIDPIQGSRDKSLGFLGNFNYWPNIDSYNILVDEWFPILRRAGWEVIVAGQNSRSLTPVPEGMEVLGEVSDLKDFYGRVSCTLAPIRLGGGIKVKVIESLARGVPVVGTEFAFEGFPLDFRENLGIVSSNLSELHDLQIPTRPDPAAQRMNIFKQSQATMRIRELLGGHVEGMRGV